MTLCAPQSPCVGICKTDEDSQLCSGCYRTIEEISGWMRYSVEKKLAVLNRLTQRRSEIQAKTKSLDVVTDD